MILEVDDIRICMIRKGEGYYYSLTSILEAGFRKIRVMDWLRTKKTMDMLFVWESLHNENFNCGEFAAIRDAIGRSAPTYFKMGVTSWIKRTNAIGLIAWRGRDGGTYGHKDIALEFAGWVNPLFKEMLFDVIGRNPKWNPMAPAI